MIVKKNTISKINFSSKIDRNKILNSLLGIFILLGLSLLSSCSSEIKNNSNRFKLGVFEIPAGKSYGKTTIRRIDSFQIENYEKIISISTDSTTSEKRIKHIDII
ncbi:MAG: hypothetical protein ACWIPJ_08945 [Polaribacter sp.]